MKCTACKKEFEELNECCGNFLCDDCLDYHIMESEQDIIDDDLDYEAD